MRAAPRVETPPREFEAEVNYPGSPNRSRILLRPEIALVIDPFGTRATLVVFAVGGHPGLGAGRRGRSRSGGRGGTPLRLAGIGAAGSWIRT